MARTSRSTSTQPQLSHELRPSSNRCPGQERLLLSPHSSTRTPSRMKGSKLSLHARSAKIKWELLHGEPCPYARPASAPSAPIPRSGGHAAAQSAARSSRDSSHPRRLLPAGMPSTHQQHSFGNGFLETPVVLARQQKSFDDATCGGGGVETLGIPQPNAATTRAKSARRGEGKGTRVRSRRDARTRTKCWKKSSPSLLEMHQRIINAALLEISRPREGPFENLGERLGGEHGAFTYCPHDGGLRGGRINADPKARGEVTLPAPAPSTPGVGASTTKGKSKALAHAGHPSRPSTGQAFRTPTAGAQHRSEVLPRLDGHEPWKIPLLRASWNPSGDDLVGNTFGDVECADSGRESHGRNGPEPQEEQANTSTTKPSEGAPQGHSAANNQSGNTTRAGFASICTTKAVTQTATHQAFEGDCSTSARRETSAATAVGDDELPELADENCADSSLEKSTVASSTSRIAVTRYVEETVLHSLRAPSVGAYDDASSGPAANGTASQIDIVANESKAMAYTFGESSPEESGMATPISRIAVTQYVEEIKARALRDPPVRSYSESSSGPAAEGTTSEEETIVATESKQMANRCSEEYLRQGLHATLAQTFEGRDPGTRVQAGYIDPACKHHLGSSKLGNGINKMLTPASLHVERDWNTTHCGSDATSPISDRMSGTTTPVSSDSSAIDFVLSEASSRKIESGGETEASVNFGLGASNHELHTLSSTRADGRLTSSLTETIVDAAATAVEGWLMDVIAKGMHAPAPVVTTRDGEMLSGCTPNQDKGKPEKGHPAASGGVQEHRAPDGSPGILLTNALPKGFLEDIVARRASLKPVADSCLTSAAGKEEDRHVQLESRLQRERGMEEEAKDRAAALRKLEILVHSEKLDRYHQVEFSRGELHGEGRHSVVYCARVSRTGRGEEGGEKLDGTQTATAVAAEVRGAAAARVASETIVEVLAAAVASAVSTASVEEQAPSAIVAAAVIDSVIHASLSAAVAALAPDDKRTLSTTLAAKEFRYLRAYAPASILRQAHQEVCMHLRVLGCANIVALRGVWLTPRVTLLLEPMSGGDLHRFSRARAAEDCAQNRQARCAGCQVCEKGRQYSRWKEVAQLVAEAAEGLAALHEAGIVHRDVKSHNVMVRQQHRETAKKDELVVGSCVCEASGGCIGSCHSGCGDLTWQAKVGDLGSAALIPPAGQAALTEEIGTSGWMSPEISGGHGYGTPSDVFSLGVLIWDAFVCGAVDNPMCGSPGQELKEGLRPPWPQPPLPMIPSDIVEVVERCWAFEPEDRPTAATVAAELRAFAAAANF